MSYPAFPNIQKPSYQYDVTPEDPGLSTQMENGLVISRPRFTRSRLTYSYKWNGMPKTDWETLLDFYRNTIHGCSQLCTWNGINGRIFDLKASAVSNSRMSVSLTFKEA